MCAPSLSQRRSACFAQRGDAGFQREVAAEVAEPADAQALQRRSRAVENRRLEGRVDRQRHARIVARLNRQQLRQVGDAARHRPFGAELAHPHVARRPERHAAGARAHTEDVVPRGGVAQRAHEVGAVGNGQQALRQRHCRAAARTAGADARVPGIGRGAEQRVEGVRAETELGHVGLADDDAACGLHARRHQAVLRGHGVFQQRAAVGGGEADRVAGVLDRLRHAVQPAAPSFLRSAAREFGVARVGLLQQGVVACQVDDGVERRVEAVDAREVGLHDLAARQRACADRRRQRLRIECGDVVAVVHCGCRFSDFAMP